MYHLFKGLHEYLTRKDEYTVVIIGLDNAGKTTMLERIKTLYNPTPGMAPDKIGPTVGQNVGKISLPSTTLRFLDLGGQRDIRSIWHKYYDACHAVVFVLDAVDQGRLAETWGVFDEVLASPRLLHLPLLLVANKQDVATSLSVAEIRESFDAWQRSRATREAEAEAEAEAGADADDDADVRGGGGGDVQARALNGRQAGQGPEVDRKGKGKASEADMAQWEERARGEGATRGTGEREKIGRGAAEGEALSERQQDEAEQGQGGWGLEDDYAGGEGREERLASLDVLGVSALEGTGVKEAVNWLYLRVQDSRRMDDRY